ncbi:MAG: HD-GYP domain-containing protein [Tepidisphaeraceae bacterium]
MLIVPLDQARAGMVLAASVAHPERPDQDLLKRGYVLAEGVIDRLRELRVPYIYVEYPALDSFDRHLEVYLSPARRALYSQIKAVVEETQTLARPSILYSDYYSTCRELMRTLMGQGRFPIYLDQMLRIGNDAVSHAAAVAHLATLLGLKLESYLIQERNRLSVRHAREVVSLGVAGMLHDIGKLKLSSDLQEFNCVNPPEIHERRLPWESHSALSYDMIHQGVSPAAAIAVLHHHQHFDGSGFPAVTHKDGNVAPLAGHGIHIFARILMCADLFDRLSTPHSGHARRSNLEVLHLMRTRYNGWLDPVVLRTLETVCLPFPPGSRVGLADGTEAVVVRLREGDPYHPIVRRLADDGWELRETPIDTADPQSPAMVTAGGKAVEGMLPWSIEESHDLAATSA